jgi:hypothetical protein
VTLKIVELAEYRRPHMAGKGSAARGYATQTKRKATDAQEKKAAQRVKLSDEAWEAWGFWCAQMNMTYDESIRYLLEHHPIDIRVPKGIRVKGATEEKKKS